MIINVDSYSACPRNLYSNRNVIELDVCFETFGDNKEVIEAIGENDVLSELSDDHIHEEFVSRNLSYRLDISQLLDNFDINDILANVNSEDLLDNCTESSIIARARDINIDKIL